MLSAPATPMRALSGGESLPIVRVVRLARIPWTETGHMTNTDPRDAALRVDNPEGIVVPRIRHARPATQATAPR